MVRQGGGGRSSGPVKIGRSGAGWKEFLHNQRGQLVPEPDAPPIDQLVQDEMEDQSDRRRPLLARTEVLLRAKLIRDGEAELDVRLRNLSQAGFMAECLLPLAPGTEVIVGIPGVGEVPAQIRWNQGFRIGGIFHFELAARELGLIHAGGEAEVIRDADDELYDAAE